MDDHFKNMDNPDRHGVIPSDARQRLLHGQVPGEYFFLEIAERTEGRLAVAFGGREACSAHYRVHRYTFPFVTLEFVASGKGEVQFDNGLPIALSAGSVFAYGPGIEVRMTATAKGMTKYFLCLAGARARELLTRPVNLWGRREQVGEPDQLTEILDLILQEGREHGPKSEALCWNSFARLLIKLEHANLMRDYRRDPSREVFVRCRSVIVEQPETLHSLEEWAQRAGVSVPTLHRLFRKFQGISPYRFLTRQKMNRAARELIGTDRLVKEIAASVGYADSLHFSRVFRQTHGLSPKQWRETWSPGGFD